MNLKQIIDMTLGQSQINSLPEELVSTTLFTWNHDLDSEKDWDDFTNGISTAHVDWTGKTFKGFIDTINLDYGNNVNSMFGMLGENEQIIVYTNKYEDLTGKFVSLNGDGENTKWYLAISFKLDNYTFKMDKKRHTFLGKLLLVDIKRLLDNQLNSADEGSIINIHHGKLGQIVNRPVVKDKDKTQTYEPEIEEIYEDPNKPNVQIPYAKTIEIFFPKPAIKVGGLDFITDKSTTIIDLEHKPAIRNYKIAKIEDASTKTRTFEQNPNYCIAPVQFKIPSVDNYGMTHPADASNAIKVLMATQSIGSVANNATSLLESGEKITGLASKIFGAGISLGQKMFGDKGTLANSTAITSTMVSGEGDAIKLFIQGDAWSETGDGNKVVSSNGEFNITQMKLNNDYLEINQANGEFGKYGKSMSPSVNGEFNKKNFIRGIGIDNIKYDGILPFLSTPFSRQQGLIINDNKIKTYLSSGAPKKKLIGIIEGIEPMFNIDNWPVYIRNMFFRPDPYSFFNWTAIMPSEIGIYDTESSEGIAYDTSVLNADFTKLAEFVGVGNNISNGNQIPASYFSKSIQLSKISDNSLGDPSQTFSGYRYELDEEDAKRLFLIRGFIFTTSTVHIRALDKLGNIIREWRFNSRGAIDGTSASVNNYWRL